MKKRFIRYGAVILACAMLFGGTAAAEEKRLGDFIYVPAMQASGVSGRFSLLAEGVPVAEHDADEGESLPIAGAEFGVYVISGDGELTPWANPLYPSEQMRIRTGEEAVSFMLPDGMEFYLRQESAPQGYIYDPAQLIPVTQEDIVVRNAMPGELVIQAVDSLGTPLAGVEIILTDEAGGQHAVLTGEDGIAQISYDEQQRILLSEGDLPQGVYAAQSVSAGGQAADVSVPVPVEVNLSRRTRVVFEHPASGTVALKMAYDCVGADGETKQYPLAGVSMEILEQGISVVTDEEGEARASLLEGLYTVRFSYQGDEEIILPLTEGSMIVESGSTTYIELSAAQVYGRVVLNAVSGQPVIGGSLMIVREDSGEAFGPYAFDGDGLLVSELLEAGEYRVNAVEAPQNAQYGGIACAGIAAETIDGLMLSVKPGAATLADVDVLTRERERFEVVCTGVNDEGNPESSRINQTLSLELIDEYGSVAAEISAQDGFAQVEALSGVYTLRMDEKQAKKLNIAVESEPFSMPAQAEAVVFRAAQSRLKLFAVDENGAALSGAVYSVTDSEGNQATIDCGEDGAAVTPLMAAGDFSVEMITAPEGYDDAQRMLVASVPSGEAMSVHMEHISFGTARIHVRMRELDEAGSVQYSPLGGVGVRLYRVTDDGQRMTDTGIQLYTGADGLAETKLESGAYVAQMIAEELPEGCRVGEALRLQMENARLTEGELICIDGMGGVRVEMLGADVSDEMLAQIRFELVDAQGRAYDMASAGSTFYAGKLPAGSYILRQTQIPQGYSLAKERKIDVLGGEVSAAGVPLEEYAVLSVAKTGLTFNDRLQTFVVPLTGEYGVFTMQNGQLAAYPSEADQMTVWSNVTPKQVEDGMTAQLKLPASMEGTTYYLREMSRIDGFAADDTYHEITLTAGAEATVSCAVSSDRGFFELEVKDMAGGEHVAGGRYALVNIASGETVLNFEMGENAYRNDMAVPVGQYTIRALEAAPGYALGDEPEAAVVVEPYLTQGGAVAKVEMECLRIPQTEMPDMIAGMYAAREQQLTLLTVESGTLATGESMIAPQMTIDVAAADGSRVTVGSVVLSGTTDADGAPYMARVEYCLAGGGWQPSDARLTGVLNAPTAVSLADVQDDIRAIRISYIHALTGEEMAGVGFAPGQITLNVLAGTDESVEITAQAGMTGAFPYRTAYDGERLMLSRQTARSIAFDAEGDGLFSTVSAGRDGRITGIAFFDEDTDGVLDAGESGRYAGLEVSLVDQNSDVVETCRTDAQGRYAFGAISGGVYTVRFNAGSSVVFSSSNLYSAHVVSSVEDTRYGVSAPISFDGDHSDYVVNVGCIYAAELGGSVVEIDEYGEENGFRRMGVELHALADPDGEPMVMMTDDDGGFQFAGILPGDYRVVMYVPDGYICEDAKDGMMVHEITFEQGDVYDLGRTRVAREAIVGGRVMIDDDGDGVISGGADTLSGVEAVLLRVEDGHTTEVARAETDDDGRYGFDGLAAREYMMLFELDGEWTFTRFGADSCVYGAVSQSGSSKSFALVPGAASTDMNVGVTLPAELTVSVFEDTYYDGVKTTSEDWMEGVSISLIRLENGEKAEQITYRTDADGKVVFAGISPGEYMVSYQLPGFWRATKQVQQETTQYPVSFVPQSTLSTGESEPFTLMMGQSGVRMYIGAMLSGALSGTVYYDDNANAKLDDAEEFCQGVMVELINARYEVQSVTQSGQDGSYSFEGIAPGRYYVQFTADEACGFSGTERTVSRGGVQASDDHVSNTKWVYVNAGEASASSDAGVVRLGSIAGRIWEDRNADTIPDGDERVLSGVTVNLMDSSGRSILTQTTTGADGMFSFANLRPDTYKLRVDAPENYVFSGAMASGVLPLDEQRDGRGYSASFQLLGGAHVEGIGYGMLTQGSVSGIVWLDNDYDGMVSGGEEGLRGATVTLETTDGTQIARQQTLRSGEFAFDGLMPGEYLLRMDLEEGYAFTAAGGDSIVGSQSGTTASILLGSLEMGAVIDGLKIGALKPAVFGGVVWLDADDDGRRQMDDTVLSDVSVVLTMLSGADAGVTMETRTDETGVYRFDQVMPGEAKITCTLPDGYAFARNASGTRRVSVIPMADACTGESAAIPVLADSVMTNYDIGVVGVGVISGSFWEDRTYNGRRDPDENGISGAVMTLVDAVSGKPVHAVVSDESGAYQIGFVRAGEYMLRAELPDGMILTLDGESVIPMSDASTGMTQQFALAMGESRTGADVGAIVPAEVSGRLLIDANEDGVCEDGESGLKGAVITLMQGGTAVASSRSDEDGRFTVGMLRPDTYRIRVTLPDDALFAENVTLRLADPDAQEGETGEFGLAMGQKLDAGAVGVVMAAEVSGRAWSDMNADGAMDGDEPALEGVAVELIHNGKTIANTVAGADGRYAFKRLRSGAYALRFTLPNGMLFADRIGGQNGSCVTVVPGNTGMSDEFALAMGEKRAHMNVGGIRPGKIGDTVWLDLDGNGLQDYKEPQVYGIEIMLLAKEADGSYSEAARTLSDEYGYYAFESLRPGSYIVRVILRDGDLLTGTFGAPLGEIDSDIDPDTGSTAEIRLQSGQKLRNIDIGFARLQQ